MPNLDETDKVCDCCGGALHKMGEEKSEKLEFIPVQIRVIEHIRPKYSCRHCEQTKTAVDIRIAPLLVKRQESLFRQHGFELSRQTMAA